MSTNDEQKTSPELDMSFDAIPASCPATRPASPLGMRPIVPVKATSAPQSRRGSFIKLHATKAKNLPPIPRAAGDVLLRRSMSATIGTAPTGRGVLRASTEPSPASYLVSDNILARNRHAPCATFGNAPSGRGLTPRTVPRKLPAITGPALIGREVAEAQLPHSYHATFGTGRTETSLRPSCDVHAYLDHEKAQPFKHTFSATIGQGKPSRPSSGCKVHSYLNPQNALPKRPSSSCTRCCLLCRSQV